MQLADNRDTPSALSRKRKGKDREEDVPNTKRARNIPLLLSSSSESSDDEGSIDADLNSPAYAVTMDLGIMTECLAAFRAQAQTGVPMRANEDEEVYRMRQRRDLWPWETDEVSCLSTDRHQCFD